MHGYFYNSSIRQYIILIGDLFSKIIVTREKEGEIVYQKVPISNATRENFIKSLDRINNTSTPQTKAKVETVLPRMNVQLIDMMYDATKKTSMLKNTSKEYLSPTQYNPVPYKFMFEVGIFTRYSKDMFQIVEQILPYFQPHFTTQLTELHGNDVKIERDINIVLQGISLDESSDGAITDRRHLEWSLMFEMTGWIYPPSLTNENQIRTIYLDFFGDTKQAVDQFESVDFQAPDTVEDITKTSDNKAYITDDVIDSIGRIKILDEDEYLLTLDGNPIKDSWTENIEIPKKSPSRMRKQE